MSDGMNEINAEINAIHKKLDNTPDHVDFMTGFLWLSVGVVIGLVSFAGLVLQ